MRRRNWLRRLGKLPVWMRYQLWQRRWLNRSRVIEAAGWCLELEPGVFDPGVFQTGAFFAEALRGIDLDPKAEVLDLGAGSGILSLEAASRGCRVAAVDINPAAVRCCRANAARHQLQGRVEALEGDLFAPLGRRRFDLVLFNPPYLTGPPKDLADRAFRDPEMPGRFAAGLKERLQPDGRALMVLSDAGRQTEFLEAIARAGWWCRLLQERRLLAETLRLFEIR